MSCSSKECRKPVHYVHCTKGRTHLNASSVTAYVDMGYTFQNGTESFKIT